MRVDQTRAAFTGGCADLVFVSSKGDGALLAAASTVR